MSLGDIVGSISLAAYVWEKGFSRISGEHNARGGDCAYFLEFRKKKLTLEGYYSGKAYNDFGREVRSLEQSLNSLHSVIQNPGGSRHQSESTADPSFNLLKPHDLHALQQMCGDHKETLERCDRLLRRKDYFRYHSGCVSNLIWSATAESEVNYLRSQIHHHIVKINSVLIPLQFHLISNLRQDVHFMHYDLVERMGRLHDETRTRLNRLERYMVHGIPHDAQVDFSERDSAIQIPEQIDIIFSRENHRHLDETGTDAFSLGSWTGAFLAHLEESTSRFKPRPYVLDNKPSEQQYLNLLKCIWIMTTIQGRQEYKDERKGSLWRTYIHDLETQLQTQTERFSHRLSAAERLCKPETSSIVQLEAVAFRIWLDDESMTDQGPPPEEDLMDVLLDFSLPHNDSHTEHRLKVLRSSADDLRIVDSLTKVVRGNRDRTSEKLNINLMRVQLIPLYATPSSSADAFNLKFRNGLDDRGISLSFKGLKDLVKFQHAITGYYVAFDKRHVAIEHFSGGSRSSTVGRVQIWIPKRLERIAPRAESEDLKGTLSYRSTLGGGMTELSRASAGAQSLSYSTAFSSTSNALPALGRASTFPTEYGSAFVHQKPRRPMLVMFLEDSAKAQNDTRKTYSFSVLKIDQNTFVNRQVCDCRRSNKQCCESSLEHRSGALEAARYSSSQDLDSWNAAALGQWQQSNADNHRVERDLKWVRLSFQNVKDRVDFAGEACRCKESDLKATDDCNKKHRGRFGEVKASYSQKLAEYNNRLELPHVAPS